MRRAGLVIADRVCESLEPGKHVVYICGPGNNGGAAFAAARAEMERPSVILAITVMCMGVSFMDNEAGWHGKSPNAEQYERAVAELDAATARLEVE